MTTTERNAATLREIREAYTFDEWIELMIDVLTRDIRLTSNYQKIQLFKELIEDNLLNSEDVEWLRSQTGIEA